MNFIDEVKYLRNNKKGLIFIFLFRFSHFIAKSNIIIKIIGFPYRVFYMVFVQWILGIDIPDSTTIGYGFSVWHGQALIIHPDCKIGQNVEVRHSTTIGQKNPDELPPVIGNNVSIGAHCVIIGNITVGNNCIIGAVTFVNKSVPDNSIVYGNPMIVNPRVLN
ncbi:MAG: serine acetyltransferase [Mucilaginibacter sp.]|nr:serine acetyltransferase [Mucilaginibacter sp.]